jgi:prepilin-type N-terminal cleavage/methylation domain-containing protein
MKRGFTLVEMVMAISLMTALLGGVLYAFGGGLRDWRKISDRAATLQIENIVAERLCRDIRGSAIMTSSTSEEIFLKIGPEVISYKLESGKVRRKKGGSVSYWTSEGEIKKIMFVYPAPNQVLVGLDALSFLVAGRAQ